MEEKKYIELQKTGNKRPFALPENYFENFAVQMDSMILKPQVKKRSVLRYWMYGAAASLIGIVMLGQAYLNGNKKQQLVTETYDSYVLSQVSENSIIDYYLASETENR